MRFRSADYHRATLSAAKARGVLLMIAGAYFFPGLDKPAAHTPVYADELRA